MESVKMELIFCEKTILDEIENKKFKREDIALTYYFCILSKEKIDWERINEAMIERWSFGGLKYIKKLNLKIPDSRLVIAGKGTDNVELTALINSHGLTNSVHQLGQVSSTEKNRLLGSAWVSLVASDVEGWSITTIEAACMGTPTIAFDVHGLRDSVIDGETGILVPYDDLDAYFVELYDLILDSSRLDRLSKNAKNHAVQFTWGSAAEKFELLIEKLEETK